MISNITLPEHVNGTQADRLDISKLKKDIDGHFLSIIAFDGNITDMTFQSVLIAQGEEMKRTRGQRALWRGWKLHGGEGQVRSRNECADAFLKTPCEYHDLIDSDILFRTDHIYSMRRHPEAKTAIICGLYCKKQDRIAHPFNSLKAGNPEPNKMGLMEIAKGPTGFMQIPRVAYEAIKRKFPERKYLCDYDIADDGVRAEKFSFFFHDIRPDQELGFMRDQSEDWAFCELARAAGVKIYADLTTTEWRAEGKPCLMHRGPALYPLRTEMERLDLANKLAELQKKYAEDTQSLNTKIAELTK